ncbi:hypothetical protein Mgra_00009947 [Meloidogyne graminicola]|uniref:Uncharacterized protein n=1 Tax=Meloidogyne graminicola TaxID=189291 RepID=A0A8S9Z842_9BILA|nr:hypothetical protein Mgra_00009947 [Meloidogyne graminicola]
MCIKILHIEEKNNNINLNKNRFVLDGPVIGLNKLQNNISLFNSEPKLSLNNNKTITTPKLVPFPIKKDKQQNGQRIVN